MIVFAKQTICTKIFIIMKHKIKLDKVNYLQLNKLGSMLNLSFSTCAIVGNKIIGLDVAQRKLLIAEKINGLFRPFFIELNKVSVISIQKIYNSIKAGDLKTRRIEEFVQSIRIQLKFGNGDNTIILPFYERTTDGLKNLRWLERKARNWQMMLSKMLREKYQVVTKNDENKGLK